MASRRHTRALVAGTGLAGLTCALELAERGVCVLLVTKAADPSDCNTYWAQGGIICGPSHKNGDSPKRLARDIAAAGDHVTFDPAVRQLVGLGPRLVREIMIDKYAVPFDRDRRGRLLMGQEGAHSRPRIIHASDATGKAIHEAFLSAARAHPNIEILTRRKVVDLLTTEHHCVGPSFKYAMENRCLGAYVLDIDTDEVRTMTADFTVLATGGAGQLFLHSTNHPGAIGDGLVVASRAGAGILFPHYVQFHPTALAIGKRRFLITEAVRGAGAHLVNSNGERFMLRYNRRQSELAPRDELTRAIIREMISREEECVYLDLSTIHEDDGPLEERFPTVFRECLQQGVDIRTQRIPVVPAAHYICGGVKVDLSGRTTLSGLYAIGEVSCTGLHGANRLASTSLLECLVWGRQAALSIAASLESGDTLPLHARRALKDWEAAGTRERVDRQRIAGDWSRIRTVMWNYVGILRSRKLLDVASRDFRLLAENLRELYFNTALSIELVDLFHGIQACQLIVDGARKDNVSLGCHFMVD